MSWPHCWQERKWTSTGAQGEGHGSPEMGSSGTSHEKGAGGGGSGTFRRREWTNLLPKALQVILIHPGHFVSLPQ
jgi:hypothetical protein